MDGSKARQAIATLHRAPTIERRASGAPGTPRGERHARLDATWAAVLGLGWPVVMAICIAIEPAPADPEASVPLLVELGGFALLFAMGATAFAAARRLPSAIRYSALAGVVSLAFTLSCPASGHHAYGLWWVGQLAVTVGMLAVTAEAARRVRKTG